MAGDIPEPTPPKPAPPGRPATRIWLKYLLGLPLGVMVLLALGLLTLDSAIGHRLLVDAIGDYEADTGMRVQIGRIGGSIFGSAVLEDVQVEDPGGAFLKVPEVALDWRPLNWFGTGLDIRNLVLKRGTLLRLPRLQAGDPNSPLLPDFDIRIDHLGVERLTIAKPVLGLERRVDFQASAAIRKASVTIKLGGKLGGGDRLVAELVSDRIKDRFHLGLNYDAPKGGLLAALADAKVDRRLRVSGKGSYANWTGGLLADQGGARLAALQLTNSAGKLGLAGLVWTDPLLAARARLVVGPRLALRGAGGFANGVLAGTLGAASVHWHVGASGGVDFSANSFNHLVLAGRSLDRVMLDPGTSIEGARGTVVLAGKFAKFEAKWRANAQQFVSDGTSLAGITAEGTASRQTQDAAAVRWLIPVTLAVGRITTGTAWVDPQLVGLRARGTLALSGGRLVSNDLALTGPRLSAHLALRGDSGSGIYVLAGRANARGWPLAAVGPTNADGSLVLTLPKAGGWALTSRLSGTVPQVENSTLARLTGDTAGFSGDIAAGSGRPVQVARASLASPLLALNLSGQLRGDGTSQLSGSGRHASLGSFSGSVALAADGPRADVVFLDPLPAAGVKDMHLALAPAGADYRLSANGASLFGPFDGVLGLAVPAQGAARLNVQHLTLSNTSITGGLKFGDNGTAGEFNLAGGGVAGKIVFVPRGGGQGVEIALAATDSRFGGDKPLTIGKGKLEASGLLLKHHTTITGSALVQGIGMGRLFIGKAAIAAKLQDGTGQITATLGGRRGSRFDLQSKIDVAPDRVALSANGVFAGQTIAMPRRAVLTSVVPSEGGAGGWRLAPSEVDFGSGRAIASGLLGNGSLELQLGLANMPLSLADVVFVDLGLGGRVSGQITYTKQREQLPQGEARLMIKGLTRSGLVLTSRPVDLALVGKLDAEALQTRAVASEAGQPRGRLQARIDHLPGQGALVDRLGAGALFAQMRYAGPADAPWRLMGIESFDLTGPMELAADITGTLEDPRISGSLASTALRLQSAQTGTDISRITAHGSFSGAQLSLSGLAGETLGGGQVSGSGNLDFANMGKGRGPAIDLRLAASHAQLLSRIDLALAASGPLRVVSDGLGGTIAGRLNIDSARWRLGKSAAVSDLPNIATREINRGADIAPASVRDLPWRFLIDAAGPGRIRVEGMGLASEWGADLRIRGTLEEPAITGRADLVTGTYDFAGRRFDLQRGRISFDGNAPPDPRLDIVATADVSGLAASVTVRGTSLKPEIGFASVPALPEEELLSRLLFGDSITKISAPEALQLGAALASLHGGGGLDPINKLRGAIGLDRLRIVSADAALGRQTGVAVGKYLGRHFYAELVTDGRGYSASNLEFRITNWLALLGSVSTIGRQSVNAKVSKDY